MKDKAVELCRDMIRIKSHSGSEKELAEYLKEFFVLEGFDQVRTDDYGNIIARLQGNRPGNCIVIDGHMDTVPVEHEEEWKYPPYGGEIYDGRIYGRGATDMKGPLAAAICGALAYKEACKGDFPGDIYIACVVQEECFEGVASKGITDRIQPDYVIIAEPSGLTLKTGQKGRAEILVETFGRAAHSSNPDVGINAVYKMMELIQGMRALPVVEDTSLGKGILELTDIVSRPYPGASVVPEYCRATFDRRLVSGETRESVMAPMQEFLKRKRAEDSELDARISFAKGQDCCYTGKELQAERFFPAWLHSGEETYIQAVSQELREGGLDAPISQYYFCTNGSHYGGELGINVLGYGPSFEHMAHILDENIEIEQLYKGMEGYRCIIRALLERV